MFKSCWVGFCKPGWSIYQTTALIPWPWGCLLASFPGLQSPNAVEDLVTRPSTALGNWRPGNEASCLPCLQHMFPGLHHCTVIRWLLSACGMQSPAQRSWLESETGCAVQDCCSYFGRPAIMSHVVVCLLSGNLPVILELSAAYYSRDNFRSLGLKDLVSMSKLGEISNWCFWGRQLFYYLHCLTPVRTV